MSATGIGLDSQQPTKDRSHVRIPVYVLHDGTVGIGRYHGDEEQDDVYSVRLSLWKCFAVAEFDGAWIFARKESARYRGVSYVPLPELTDEQIEHYAKEQ